VIGQQGRTASEGLREAVYLQGHHRKKNMHELEKDLLAEL